MTKCLYVGNLPHECSEEDIRSLLGVHLEALEKVTLVVDRRTGRSRGFAFVDMNSEEAAAVALESLKGSQLAGRELKIGNAYKGKHGVDNKGGGFEDEGGSFGGPRRGRGRGR